MRADPETPLEWNKDEEDFIDVVTVQEARHSAGERPVFTVNLGVSVKSFHWVIWGKPLGGSVSEADCAVRVRLGDLIQGKPYGDGNDQWWTVEADGLNLKQLGDELHNSLTQYGVPFLEALRDYPAIADHLQHVTGWQAANPLIQLYRALAEWKSGDAAGARKTLHGISAKAWEPKVVRVQNLIDS